MTTLSEGKHVAEFLLDYTDEISFDKVTVAASQGALVSGTVMGQKTIGATSHAAGAGNTGTGAMGTVTAGAGAMPGVYKVVMIEPGTDAGKFTVEDPNGVTIGTGTVAVAFSAGGIGFTIADATDFVSGDSFTITVAEGTDEYVPYDPAATNGASVAKGVLYSELVNVAAAQPAAIVARLAEVKADELTGLDAAARKQLAALNIICRD
jgi:hypothetical protein